MRRLDGGIGTNIHTISYRFRDAADVHRAVELIICDLVSEFRTICAVRLKFPFRIEIVASALPSASVAKA